MTEIEAWMLQTDSDFAAARRVLVETDATTYCQAIAKYQQVTEKSINVMDAALHEQGVLFGRVRAEHLPIHMKNRLIRIPREKNKDLAARLERIFRRWWPDVYDLCSLAPKLPLPGEDYKQNTEYPFQERGVWTAPAAGTSFTLAQVQRFEKIARQLRSEARQIVAAARLNKLIVEGESH